LTTVDDDSAGYSATAGTHYVHFVPPTDWVANTAENGPNGQEGYFVACALTALTDVTQQPLATQGWVLPLSVGSGVNSPIDGTIGLVDMTAGTKSGTNADSTFLLVNITKGTCVPFTWTKATAFDSAEVSLVVNRLDQIGLVQITEDGTTELAAASFACCM
jgi:hypothetical protein